MPAWSRVYLAIWRRFMGGIMPSIVVSQCYLRIKSHERWANISRVTMPRRNRLWDGDRDRVTGSITMDGSDPELASGQAHLRWFILHDS